MSDPQRKRPAGVKIAGTGMATGSRRVTNNDLAKFVDTSDEWITQRTGIRERRLVENGTKTSDLAAAALRQALHSASLDPSQLDLVLCATMTPDVICPASACEVVRKVGAIPCGAMDINIACTGMVAGLNTGAAMVQSGQYRHVGVIGADTLSRIVNWEDRRTCVLFGDAAGAVVLSGSDDEARGPLYHMLGSDAQRGEALFVPRSEADIPDGSRDVFTGKFDTLQMDGKAVYEFAVRTLTQCVKDAMHHTNLTADNVSMVIAHQSNLRMLRSAWKRLGFAEDQVYVNIERFGNTSAASIGLCLHELVDAGRLTEGNVVIFVAQGGGLSWGANVWRL